MKHYTFLAELTYKYDREFTVKADCEQDARKRAMALAQQHTNLQCDLDWNDKTPEHIDLELDYVS